MTDSAAGGSTPHLLMESFVRQVLERLRTATLLAHPGEVGRAREHALRDHLRSFLPPSIGVSTGFVIDALGGRSRQIDLIVHFSDYHAVFNVVGIPLVPVEAVIAVFEIKSSVASRGVLHDCYDVLKSVKQLDRGNAGRNVVLIHKEPVPIAPELWRQHFQLQVFGAVLSVESCSDDLWLQATHEWCSNNERADWPNFYCGVNDYIGTYNVQVDGEFFASPDPNEGAVELMTFPPAGQSSLGWATQEVLNFLRVAQRVDYLPTSYLSLGPVPERGIKKRPLP